jgi:class 3 adenylate cyclase
MAEETDDLQMRLDLVARNQKFSDGLVERFGQWIQTAEDADLFRVGVVQWAKAHEVGEDEALDLFLHATKAGIFEMTWGVLCPSCGMLVTTPGGLKALGPDPHCQVCRVEFPAALDDQVEVTFSVEPAIRNLRYYDPSKVDAVRDLFKIFWSPAFEITDKQRQMVECIEGTIRLAPRESGTLELNTAPGLYSVFSPTVHAVSYVDGKADGPNELSIEIHDGMCLPPNTTIGSGPSKVTVENRTDYTITACAFNFGPHKPEDFPYTDFQMKPFISGKRMLTSQTFRDIFRTETIGSSGLRLKNLTVLFSDLQASTELYERVGDLRALELVREHFEKLHSVVRRHRGTLVKTIGDAVMAVFSEPERAVAAAAGMNRAVRKIDADGEKLAVKVGVHSGPCVAIQTNHQIDYFGTAVNAAARVQGAANGGEILITNEIWNAPGMEGLVEDLGLDQKKDQVELRGIAGTVEVHRLFESRS